MRSSAAPRIKRRRRKFRTGNHVAAGYAAPVAAERTKPLRGLLVSLMRTRSLIRGRPGAELRLRFDSLIALRADTKFVKADTLKLPSPDQYDVAILALFVRVSDRKGNVDVPADQLPVIEQILKAGKPVIMVGLGSPYLIEKFPQAETWLSAFASATWRKFRLRARSLGKFPCKDTCR